MRKILIAIPLLIAALCASAYRSPEETAEALRELQERVDSGEPEAQYRLALLFEKGYDTIPADSLRFTALLTEAAEGGHLPAQNYLGYILFRQGDTSQGLRWLERAAISGDPKAQSNLGFLLLGDAGGCYGGSDARQLRAGIEPDAEKAAFWLGRASQSGSATASSMLGDLYRDGLGVAQDSLQAAACYYAAIDAGLADAAYKLEAMERDNWSHLPGDEQLTLALYLYTHRVPDLAIPIFSRLATNETATSNVADDSDELPDVTPEIRAAALALLGDAYTRALGVGYDYDLSLRYYWEAAEMGNAPAQFVISELLEIFPDALDALSPNPPSAEQLRQSAAAQGITTAEEATIRLMNP